MNPATGTWNPWVMVWKVSQVCKERVGEALGVTR